ncbi:hypothetical protein AQI95_01770 [Streptomyces yokosukanensis]|uniref:Uncharacterized protein n=1 Tax=Streptomyces yokosukanensis TaxID=67386 RepID=A0A101PFC0_9ACTN|nr:hypothetical protein AQI95_01770 [Streptomyces yokosukanensis]
METANRLAVEPMFTMRPPSFSRGRARWITKNGAVTLTASSRSHSSKAIREIGLAEEIPALLTRMSSPRPSSPAASPPNSRSTAPTSPNRACTANARPPASSIRFTVSSAASPSVP